MRFLSTAGKGPCHTHFRVCVLFIVEDRTVTEMQNSNKSVFSLVEFISKCHVEQSLLFIYVHIFSETNAENPYNLYTNGMNQQLMVIE
jgi:hypothetical protein